MVTAIIELGKSIIGGFTEKSKAKHQRKMAVINRQTHLAESAQSHNQSWELKQLDNVGWKDDILFYAFLGVFVWAGVDPDGAKQFFENLQNLPEWFIKTWFYLLAGVLGVKKIGEYIPAAFTGIRGALKKQL